MVARKKPSRSWEIDDLLDLGKKSGATYLKATPILILETWLEGDRQEGVANFIRTKDLVKRLEHSKLVSSFKPKGSSNVCSALIKLQSGRNLTDPPLIEYQGGGTYWIKLPHYEALLQEYYQIYRERYQDDYAKLFPDNDLAETQIQDEIHDLLAPLEQALRERETAVKGLTEENQKLQSELVSLKTLQHMIADKELRNDCAEFLKQENTYIDAIRRAGVVLEERLKKTIGGDGPEKFKQGVELVDYALRKDSGWLIVSEHPAEQEGVHLLFRGAVQFVRNPPSHKKMQYTEFEAVQAIGLIDYLLLLLQQTKRRLE